MTDFGRRTGGGDMLKAVYDPIIAAAIHRNVAGEFAGVTNKATPTYTDLFLLEDSAAAYVKKRSNLKALQLRNFVDRGDPQTWDWNIGDLTTDGNWHTLDATGIVPVYTTWVLLGVTITDDLVSTMIRFRKPGKVWVPTSPRVVTHVANKLNQQQVLVGVHPSARQIEYRATSTTITSIYIAVEGWFVDQTL